MGRKGLSSVHAVRSGGSTRDTGNLKRLATGFAGATNLAIGKHGRIYVTELLREQDLLVRRGHVTHFVDLPGVVSVERGVDVRPPDRRGTLGGSIVRINYYGGMDKVM